MFTTWGNISPWRRILLIPIEIYFTASTLLLNRFELGWITTLLPSLELFLHFMIELYTVIELNNIKSKQT